MLELLQYISYIFIPAVTNKILFVINMTLRCVIHFKYISGFYFIDYSDCFLHVFHEERGLFKCFTSVIHIRIRSSPGLGKLRPGWRFTVSRVRIFVIQILLDLSIKVQRNMSQLRIEVKQYVVGCIFHHMKKLGITGGPLKFMRLLIANKHPWSGRQIAVKK